MLFNSSSGQDHSVVRERGAVVISHLTFVVSFTPSCVSFFCRRMQTPVPTLLCLSALLETKILWFTFLLRSPSWTKTYFLIYASYSNRVCQNHHLTPRLLYEHASKILHFINQFSVNIYWNIFVEAVFLKVRWVQPPALLPTLDLVSCLVLASLCSSEISIQHSLLFDISEGHIITNFGYILRRTFYSRPEKYCTIFFCLYRNSSSIFLFLVHQIFTTWIPSLLEEMWVHVFLIKSSYVVSISSSLL